MKTQVIANTKNKYIKNLVGKPICAWIMSQKKKNCVRVDSVKV